MPWQSVENKQHARLWSKCSVSVEVVVQPRVLLFLLLVPFFIFYFLVYILFGRVGWVLSNTINTFDRNKTNKKKTSTGWAWLEVVVGKMRRRKRKGSCSTNNYDPDGAT